MVPQKDNYTQDEVDRMIKDARDDMRFEILERDYKEHKTSVEKTLAKILEKIGIVMENEQVRSRELIEFRLGLKEEFAGDFVTKEEFKSLRRSVVLAVTIVVSLGGLIQWLLSTYTSALKIVGAD